MPLSDREIKRALNEGHWTAKRDGYFVSADQLTIGPNSVNVSLADEIFNVQTFYTSLGVDLHDPNSFHVQRIRKPYRLQPGYLYLAAVREAFDCSAPLWIPQRYRFRDKSSNTWFTEEEEVETYFFPDIDGRSTCGRIGLAIHQTAGRGDYGFAAPFTLELTVTHATLVRPGDEIGQVYFSPLQGKPSEHYRGAYAGQTGPQPARLGRDRFQRAGEGA